MPEGTDYFDMITTKDGLPSNYKFGFTDKPSDIQPWESHSLNVTYNLPSSGTYVGTAFFGPTSSGGCYPIDLRIKVDANAPTVDIISPQDQSMVNTSDVTAQWQGDGDVDHYEIRKDGGAWEDVGTSTSKSFTFSEGQHNVTVKVYDSVGNSNSDMVTFTVDTIKPIVEIDSPAEVYLDVEVTFNGSNSTDATSGIATFEWDFGDNTSATGETVTHSYSQLGDYDVELTVTDFAGNQNSTTEGITVKSQDTESPTADAGEDVTITVGDQVILDGSNSSDDLGIDNYTWEFEYNGTTRELYGSNPTFTFDEAGTYQVTLTVTDTVDKTDTDQVTVTVEEEGEDGDGPGIGAGDSWWIYLIAAIIIIAVIVALLMMRKRGPEEAEEPYGGYEGETEEEMTETEPEEELMDTEQETEEEL